MNTAERKKKQKNCLHWKKILLARNLTHVSVANRQLFIWCSHFWRWVVTHRVPIWRGYWPILSTSPIAVWQQVWLHKSLLSVPSALTARVCKLSPPHPISILKSKQINKTEIPSFAAWSNMNETKAQYAINKRHLSIMIKNISSIIFILFCIHSNVVSAIFLSWIRHKLLQDRQESEMIDKFQQSFDFDRDRPTCGSILILKFHQIATFSIFNQVWLRLG